MCFGFMRFLRKYSKNRSTRHKVEDQRWYVEDTIIVNNTLSNKKKQVNFILKYFFINWQIHDNELQ